MKNYRWLLLAINLIGGSAVIGSYIWGLAGRAGAADILWGGVPEAVRPYYTAGMLLAALGYFAFTYFLLFRINPANHSVFGRLGAWIYPWLYLGILAPSALWLPATFWAVGNQNAIAVWIVRGVLILVALFSLGLLAALLGAEPRRPALAHALAVVGAAFFCVQTVILDAVVWGAAFGA
ncbi:MAG: hypothetical protein JW929_07650 [Anaerolineales bacterium]|nr:hypothetical protein [Anaerolineales bacterium]